MICSQIMTIPQGCPEGTGGVMRITIKDISNCIITETPDFLAIDKPAGLAVETKKSGEPDLISLVKKYRYEKGEDTYVAPIHRIDQVVSGVCLVAKNKETAAYLSDELQNNRITRIYEARVSGVIPEESGELRDLLYFDKKKNISIAVPEKEIDKYPKGTVKKAVLRYIRLSTDGENSVLKIELETGRHHQIRCQLANAGYPIIGDEKYGGINTGVIGIELVSRKLEFKGKDRKKYEIECKQPASNL